MSVLNTSSLVEMSITSVTNNGSVVHVPEGCMTTKDFQFVPWDNEDQIISQRTSDTLRLLLTGICMPLLFIVGFPTNIINMIVFYKHGLQERINACLFTLSLVDLLGISVAFSMESDVLYLFIIGKEKELGPSGKFFVDNHMVGLSGFVIASHLVYSVIAVERCLCITRPLLAKHFMSTKTTVLVLWVMIFIVTGGQVFIAGVRDSVVCLFEPRDNSVSYRSYPTDFYFRHQFILNLMYGVVYGLFLPGMSLVCVLVCTVITAVKLKKLSTWRETVSSTCDSVTSRDIAITRVLIGTSVLFIVCFVPAVVMRTSYLVVPGLRVGGRLNNLAWVMIRFYQVGAAVNNTFNFFIYYMYGSKFRETVHRVFPFCHHNTNTKNKP